jgi:hypothetical protein
MRDMLAACLAVALCCGPILNCASGEEEGGPGHTVQQFYRHLNDGAYVEAKGLYNAEALAVLDDPDVSSDEGFRAWAQQETKSGIISEVTIVNSSVEEMSAAVEFEIVYGDGTRLQRSVTLTQEAGQWKLGFIS